MTVGSQYYCEERINRLVYELYGLTEEKTAIVGGKCQDWRIAFEFRMMINE